MYEKLSSEELNRLACKACVKSFEIAYFKGLSVLFYDNNYLFTYNADGTRKIIKRLRQSNKILPKRFTLI